MLIEQQISLRFLVPRALAILDENDLVEADLYPGDLLLAVLSINKSYWHERVEEWGDVNLIAAEVMQACEFIREPLKTFKLDTVK